MQDTQTEAYILTCVMQGKQTRGEASNPISSGHCPERCTTTTSTTSHYSCLKPTDDTTAFAHTNCRPISFTGLTSWDEQGKRACQGNCWHYDTTKGRMTQSKGDAVAVDAQTETGRA